MKKAIKKLLGISAGGELSECQGLEVRHKIPTYACSLDDDPHGPDEELIRLCLNVLNKTFDVTVSDIAALCPGDDMKKYVMCWPGEHYRLLAGFVSYLQPKTVIEIGTATGAATLTLKKYMPKDGAIVTYDIVRWNEYPSSALRKEHFEKGVEQRIKNLSVDAEAQTEMETLSNADLIFVDAAKDGPSEIKFIELFNKISFKKPPVVIFDDIRMPSMLKIWRDIEHPKLDLTSFGHWAGTGVVHWR